MKIDREKLEPQKFQRLLSEWFAERETTGIKFREDIQPASDPDEEYTVAYEAVFEPSSLEQARVELWITKEGEVAVGLENYKRVAERLDVKCWSDRFAAGHEPHSVNASGLFSLLDSIADGRIAISSTVLPIIGLISTKAIASSETFDGLVSRGYRPISWLKKAKDFNNLRGRSLLRFQRW